MGINPAAIKTCTGLELGLNNSFVMALSKNERLSLSEDMPAPLATNPYQDSTLTVVSTSSVEPIFLRKTLEVTTEYARRTT
jgi:hypothetical protein